MDSFTVIASEEDNLILKKKKAMKEFSIKMFEVLMSVVRRIP